MSFSPFNAMSLPYQGRGAGKRDEFGTYTPPGGRVVAYVHNSGEARIDDTLQQVPVLKTLNQALNGCRAGYGDTVLVLPGHAEDIATIDAMSNLKAGCNVIGLGSGPARPTFRWVAAGATFLLDQANVLLSNLRLHMDPGAGGVTVAAPMTVSAAGCIIDGCQIRMGTDVNNKPTIGITTTAGADDLTISNNDIYSALSTVAVTTAIRIVGGSRLRMVNNTIQVGTSAAAVGVVQMLTTAPLQCHISDNVFANLLSTSTHAFTGMAGASGILQNCVACIGALTGAGQGFNTLGNMYPGGNLWVALDDGATGARPFPTA